VHAEAVQADLPGAQHLVADERVGGEGVEAVGMVGLVERELDVHRLVVERDVAMVGAGEVDHRDLAHAEVRLHDVRRRPGAAHARLDLVEERVVQGPEPGLGDGDVELDAALAPRDLPFHRGHAASLERQAQREVLGRRFAQPGVHGHLLRVDVGRELKVAEHGAPARLQVGRLPDAAGVAVALLALELERAVHVVHAEDQALRRARTRVRRQLELERRVAALVLAELLSVEPGGGVPVGGADDQEHAPSLPGRGDLDRARVPADLRLVGDARQRGSPREGHGDGQRELRLPLRPGLGQPLVRRIEAERPGAVEVHPRRALEVGARVLRQRNLLLGSCRGREQHRCRDRRRDSRRALDHRVPPRALTRHDWLAAMLVQRAHTVHVRPA
jgi:hypothetical protein